MGGEGCRVRRRGGGGGSDHAYDKEKKNLERMRRRGARGGGLGVLLLVETREVSEGNRATGRGSLRFTVIRNPHVYNMQRCTMLHIRKHTHTRAVYSMHRYEPTLSLADNNRMLFPSTRQHYDWWHMDSVEKKRRGGKQTLPYYTQCL